MFAASTLKDQLEEEIATDSMRALEHKTYNAANELMAVEQLDELRKINKRFLNRESTVDDALVWLKQGGLKTAKKEQEEQEKEELRKRLEGKNKTTMYLLPILSFIVTSILSLIELDGEDLEDFERAKEDISRRLLDESLGHEAESKKDDDNTDDKRGANVSRQEVDDKQSRSSNIFSSSTLLEGRQSALLIRKRRIPQQEQQQPSRDHDSDDVPPSTKRPKTTGSAVVVNEASAGTDLLGMYDSSED